MEGTHGGDEADGTVGEEEGAAVRAKLGDVAVDLEGPAEARGAGEGAPRIVGGGSEEKARGA